MLATPLPACARGIETWRRSDSKFDQSIGRMLLADGTGEFRTGRRVIISPRQERVLDVEHRAVVIRATGTLEKAERDGRTGDNHGP